jgi:hypothetical protein
MMAPPPPIFQVGHLERVPLGTPYPGVVAHVGRLLTKLPGHPELVIDFTGVGRPVFDMFVYSGISPTGVLITGGTAETRDGATCSKGGLVLSTAPIRGCRCGNQSIGARIFSPGLMF